MTRAPDPERLVVGHISKPHGVKGELYVWPLTDRVDRVYAAGRTLLLGDDEGEVAGTPEAVVIETVRPYKRGLLVRFEGYPDRTAAEPLARRYLLLEADEVEPLDEDELFYHQLLGLEVETVDGERLGRVREVFETEPAHLLEVKGEGVVRLVPLAERIVKRIDLEEGRLVIDPPPGLLEL